MSSRKSNPLLFLRRRPIFVYGSFEYTFNLWSSSICDFENHQKLFDKLVYDTCEDIYWTYFHEDLTESSKEWIDIKSYIENLVTEKYANKVKQTYNENCGNPNLSLEESVRRILREEIN